MVDKRGFGVEGRKSLCTKEQDIKGRDNPVTP